MSERTLERYRALQTDMPADEIEKEVLARWESEQLFARTQAAPEDKPRFVFFEGPPTANGRPGIHHGRPGHGCDGARKSIPVREPGGKIPLASRRGSPPSVPLARDFRQVPQLWPGHCL